MENSLVYQMKPVVLNKKDYNIVPMNFKYHEPEVSCIKYFTFSNDYGIDVYLHQDLTKEPKAVLSEEEQGRLVTALRWMNFPTNKIEAILSAYITAHQVVDDTEALMKLNAHKEDYRWYSSDYDK